MKILVNSKLSEHRYKTPEGYLVCVDSVLARTGKQTYRRDELFHDNDATEIEVDRPENEVFSEQTLASFENKPLTIEHPEEDVNPHNYKTYAVGFIRDIKRGTDNGEPVMLGTLVVTDEDAIKDIEDGKLPELSCGYDCDIADDDNPQQRNIRGNHVALCEHGRAGNARIVDSINDGKRLPAKVKNEIRRFLNHKSTFIKNRDYDVSEFVQEFERMTRLWAEFPLKITRESIRGWNKMGDGMMRKDYVFSIDGYDEEIIVSLYAKPDTYETTELNTYFLDSTTKAVNNMNPQEKGTKGLEKQVDKLVEDNAKDILAALLTKYGFKIVRDGKTWTGRTHIEFTGDYFDEDNRWLVFDKARQKIDRLEAEAKQAGIRMTFNIGTANNIVAGTIDAEQIHDSIKDAKYVIKHPKRDLYLTVGAKTWSDKIDPMIKKFDSEKEAEEYAKKNTSDFKIAIFDSVKDEFDYEYAKHFRALEQDMNDMYRQYKQYGNKTPSDILTAKGYKDGYGDTMTKKIDKYEYVVDFDDIGYVKYYVRKDGKVPAGWTITKMTFTDCVPDEKDRKVNKLVGIVKALKDDRLSPSTYKALKELGVRPDQWRKWNQEQASNYIEQHQKATGKTTSEKTNKTKEYIDHVKTVKNDLIDARKQFREWDDRSPVSVLEEKGYKDGPGETMTKKVGQYEYIVDFNRMDFGEVKFYVKKDGKLPEGVRGSKIYF